MKIFAAFVVAPAATSSNRTLVAATTRASDRGEAGRIGLPGGKLDMGESAYDAALREAREEGWYVEEIADVPFHTATVEGKTVAWFAAKSARALLSYKEQGRIRPLAVSVKDVAESGYGNAAAMAAWVNLKGE
mgnify:FL=1